VGDDLIAPIYLNGTIELGSDGCGMTWVLVVSGPQLGRIWRLSEFGAYPCDPPLSFLDWYEAWLDGNPPWQAIRREGVTARPLPPEDSLLEQWDLSLTS
jgi:hypothetical protein